MVTGSSWRLAMMIPTINSEASSSIAAQSGTITWLIGNRFPVKNAVP